MNKRLSSQQDRLNLTFRQFRPSTTCKCGNTSPPPTHTHTVSWLFREHTLNGLAWVVKLGVYYSEMITTHPQRPIMFSTGLRRLLCIHTIGYNRKGFKCYLFMRPILLLE